MFNGNQKIKRKRGKPVTHPPILNIDTGQLFRTYTEAAESICGDRTSVMRVCEKVQSHHKGYHFRYFTEEDCRYGMTANLNLP